MYRQYPYELFNQIKLEEYEKQERIAKDREQNEKIDKLVNSLREYLKISKEIEPEFRAKAIDACFFEIFRQCELDRRRQYY